MKVQVNVNDEMVKRIDILAQSMGVSRSALCSIFIGQGMLQFDKSDEIMQEISTKFLEYMTSRKDEDAEVMYK